MSLMNDMLRDLEKRQAPDRSQQVEAQGYGVLTQKSESHSSRIVLLLLGTIIVMLVVLAAGWWYLKAPSQSSKNSGLALQEPTLKQNKAAVGNNTVHNKTVRNEIAGNEVAGNEIVEGKIITPSEQSEPLNRTSDQPDIASASLVDPAIDSARPELKKQPMPLGETEKTSVTQTDVAVIKSNATPVTKAEQNTDSDPELSTPAQSVSEDTTPIVETKHKIQKPLQLSMTDKAKPTQHKTAQTISKVLVISPEQQDENAANEASKLLQSGDTKKGRELLSQFISTHDVDIQSRALLVSDLIKNGENAAAETFLVDEKLRQSSHLRRLKAHILSQNGQPEEAIAVLNSARPDIASDPEYHVLLAALYQQQGFSAEAVAAYAELIRYDADVADWWVGMAIGLDSSQQYPSARKAYKKALQMEGLRFELADFAKQRLATLGG